jgi:hypothetical protein
LREKWRSGAIGGVLAWESPLKACPHARGERTRVGASSEGVCGRTSYIQQRNAGERTDTNRGVCGLLLGRFRQAFLQKGG